MTLLPAISIHQPWASFIAHGIKQTEGRTHTRFSSLIGKRVAIHATKTWDESWNVRVPLILFDYVYARAAECGLCDEDVECLDPSRFPQGGVIATGTIIKMITLDYATAKSKDIRRAEALNFTFVLPQRNGRGGDVLYRLANVRRLETPIPAKGRQGIWFVEVGE